jgi:hypothetical protein
MREVISSFNGIDSINRYPQFMGFIEENNLHNFDELNQLHEHTSAWRFAQK